MPSAAARSAVTSGDGERREGGMARSIPSASRPARTSLERGECQGTVEAPASAQTPSSSSASPQVRKLQ
jgi:hypothetical protein